MMLHWHGYGWIVPAIGFGGNVVAQMLADAVFGQGFFHKHAWPGVVATTVAAIAIWFIADRFERSHQEAVAELGVDLPQREHSFMWLNIRWWAPILMLLAFVVALGKV